MSTPLPPGAEPPGREDNSTQPPPHPDDRTETRVPDDTAMPARAPTVQVAIRETFPQPFGRYTLLKQLGGGGMGTVYLAYDSRFDLEVALKVPHPHLTGRPEILERFYREARAAARLCHPGLCQVFDIGDWNGIHYMTMRFIAGEPLSKARPDTPEASAALVARCAVALAEAHRLGVIHRDLKPSNVLVTPTGEPVVTDFGLALRLDVEAERLADEGALLGTLPYVCPEHARGDADAFGPAADIYSLGVMLYELLTGELPFTAPNAWALIHRIAHEPPPPPSALRPDLDARLETIVLRALAKHKDERFPSMLDFAAELTGWQKGSASTIQGNLQGRTTVVDRPEQDTGPRPLIPRESVRFAFAGYGTRAPAGPAAQDRLYLDVGNDLRPGVLDHHHLTAYTGATASLLLAHPALVDGAVKRGRAPSDPFTIVLHEQPDLDGIASSFLAVAYLSTRAFPAGAEALARYTDKVDEGALGMTLANPFALYAAYMQVVNRLARRSWNSDAERWRECVRQGLDLVAYAIGEMTAKGTPLPAVDVFACPDQFSPEDRAEVLGDIDRYRRKLADPRCHARRATLRLPGQFGGSAEVDALLARDVQNLDDPQRCIFFKDWARSDTVNSPNGRGFVALSVFMSEGPRAVRRCILSVKPDDGVTLRGLGAQLDRAESERRQQIHGVDDRVTDPASGESKPERPGYANADPWYDGRAHGYTIVDAPRAGTVLTADEIEAVFLRFGGASGADPVR